MEPYEALANAIILQAADDYKTFYRKMVKLQNTDTTGMDEKLVRGNARKLKKTQANFEDAKAFFGSRWYQALTDVDAEIIVAHLNKECGIE